MKLLKALPPVPRSRSDGVQSESLQGGLKASNLSCVSVGGNELVLETNGRMNTVFPCLHERKIDRQNDSVLSVGIHGDFSKKPTQANSPRRDLLGNPIRISRERQQLVSNHLNSVTLSADIAARIFFILFSHLAIEIELQDRFDDRRNREKS